MKLRIEFDRLFWAERYREIARDGQRLSVRRRRLQRAQNIGKSVLSFKLFREAQKDLRSDRALVVLYGLPARKQRDDASREIIFERIVIRRETERIAKRLRHQSQVADLLARRRQIAIESDLSFDIIDHRDFGFKKWQSLANISAAFQQLVRGGRSRRSPKDRARTIFANTRSLLQDRRLAAVAKNAPSLRTRCLVVG